MQNSQSCIITVLFYHLLSIYGSELCFYVSLCYHEVHQLVLLSALLSEALCFSFLVHFIKLSL